MARDRRVADVVQRTDVRVIELRDGAGLAVEALAELRIGGFGCRYSGLRETSQ